MSNSKKSKDLYKSAKKRESFKKDFQSIIMVGIISVLVVVALIVMFIFLNKSKTLGEVTFPSNPLTQENNSRYSYIERSELPTKLNMPTIPVLLSLGGSERYVPYNGYVYLYSSDLYISVYETTSTYDLYTTQVVSDLYAGEFGSRWVYNQKGSNGGYFNGYPTTYEYGQFDVLDEGMHISKSIYYVSFTINLGLSQDLNITISTPEPSKLYNAGKLLQAVGETIMDTSHTSYVDENSEVQGSADVGIPILYE